MSELLALVLLLLKEVGPVALLLVLLSSSKMVNTARSAPSTPAGGNWRCSLGVQQYGGKTRYSSSVNIRKWYRGDTFSLGVLRVVAMVSRRKSVSVRQDSVVPVARSPIFLNPGAHISSG